MTNPLKIKLEFAEDRILFTAGYPFKHSSIYQTNEVHATQIGEVVLKTFPFSLVINHNEVVFLEYDYKIQADLEKFAARNGLAISVREDIWYLLCAPFLDTEFEADEKRAMIYKLEQSGFQKREIKRLRRKIGFVLWVNYLGWEWVYLGQFDYLRFKMFLTAEAYWWTMSIALKNYHQNKQHTTSVSRNAG